MKFRKSIIASITMISLFCFSTQTVFATELDESEVNENGEDLTEVKSDEVVEVLEDSNKSAEETQESPKTEISSEDALEETHTKTTQEVDVDSKENEEVKVEQQERKATSFSTKSNSNEVLIFKEGDRHEAIIELKVKLNAIGFDNISETDYFGSWTTTRVKQFQANYGLTATGIADVEMQEKLDEVYYSPYQLGGSNPGIVSLKRNLNLMGFNGISLTENYGNWTKTRVSQFQRFIGLKDNGIADAYTRQKLDEFVATGFGKGDRHSYIVDMKQKLNALGFDRISETTLYGGWTVTRVKQFQEAYDLVPTGRANGVTLAALDEVFSNSFYVGSEDPAIVDLKKKLNRMGFDRISETPKYGSWTATRVKQFQSFIGLAETGIADPLTIEKLDEFVIQGFKKGDRHDVLVTVKKNLNALGFDGIKTTNYFGNWTKTRVEQFQDYYGLEVTGRVNGATLDKIDEILNSPYQLGKRHDDLIQLKHNLNWLDYGYISVTTLYGSFTEKMVKKFQEDNGLPVSGIAEPNTLAKIDEVLNEVFEQGKSHEGIIVLKNHLNNIGFGGITVTINYGNFTQQRVSEFQEYYGLEVTGTANSETRDMILSIVDSPYQEGKRHNSTIQLKENLNRLGFGNISVTTLYGSFTANQVKAFQAYYGLVKNGIADPRTLAKIDELVNSPFQEGKRHDATVTLKENLNRLGFGHITVSTLYGSFTAKQVSAFQEYYGLRVNGIADDRTFAKINEILNSPFQQGLEHEDTVRIKEYLNLLGFGPLDSSILYDADTEAAVRNFQDKFGLRVNGIADEVTFATLEDAASAKEIFINEKYNISLTEALAIQMKANPQSDKYYSGYVSSKYLDIYEAGVITGSPVNLRTSPSLKNYDNVSDTVLAGTAFKLLDSNVKGDEFSGSTKWYKIDYKGKTLYVHSTLASIGQKVGETTVNLNVRAGAGTSYHIYETVKKGTVFTIANEAKYWTKVNLGYAWRNATPEDTLAYLDPTAYINDPNQKFQFLDLRHFTGASAAELDKLLEGAGVLEGMGSVFREAAKDANINEVYLVSHALLETGRGTSDLSNGSIKHNGNPVYNFFGIGAVDGCAKKCGTERAIAEGWFSVEAAIRGGAMFAGDKYINAGQNTLYKMRWNPNAMVTNNKASHQYATDIGWAAKQIYNYKRIYDNGIYNLLFEVPVYK